MTLQDQFSRLCFIILPLNKYGSFNQGTNKAVTPSVRILCQLIFATNENASQKQTLAFEVQSSFHMIQIELTMMLFII